MRNFLLSKKRSRESPENEKKEIKRPTQERHDKMNPQEEMKEESKMSGRREGSPMDLENLTIKEMFAHIMHRLDKDEETRKRDYEKLAKEVRALRSDMQMSLEAQEEKLGSRIRKIEEGGENREQREEIANLEGRIGTLEKKIDEWRSEGSTQAAQVTERKNLQEMEWRMEVSERNERKRNIIIKGMETGIDKKDLQEKVEKFFKCRISTIL